MNITQHEIGPLHHRIDISIEHDDYKDKFKQDLKKYAQQADMRGFRKGKVPPSLLKKMYGKSVLADLISEILNDAINEHLEKNKLNTILSPYEIRDEDNPFVIKINEPKTYEFSFEYGVEPEFELDSFFSAQI